MRRFLVSHHFNSFLSHILEDIHDSFDSSTLLLWQEEMETRHMERIYEFRDSRWKIDLLSRTATYIPRIGGGFATSFYQKWNVSPEDRAWGKVNCQCGGLESFSRVLLFFVIHFRDDGFQEMEFSLMSREFWFLKGSSYSLLLYMWFTMSFEKSKRDFVQYFIPNITYQAELRFSPKIWNHEE